MFDLTKMKDALVDGIFAAIRASTVEELGVSSPAWRTLAEIKWAAKKRADDAEVARLREFATKPFVPVAEYNRVNAAKAAKKRAKKASAGPASALVTLKPTPAMAKAAHLVATLTGSKAHGFKLVVGDKNWNHYTHRRLAAKARKMGAKLVDKSTP